MLRYSGRSRDDAVHRLSRTIDMDVGKTLIERIDDLTRLLAAYRSGAIKEHSR